jgi:hypothetical protein
VRLSLLFLKTQVVFQVFVIGHFLDLEESG